MYVVEAPPSTTPSSPKPRMFPPLNKSDVTSSYFVSPTLHSDFFLVTVSRTFYYMGISSQTFFLYYLRDVVHLSNPSAGVTVLTAVAQAGAAIASYPVGRVSDRLNLGRKPFIYLSCMTLFLGNFSFMYTRTLLSVCGVAGIVGLGNGGYLAMDSALAVDVIPEKDKAAKYLGIWGVASFVGTGES